MNRIYKNEALSVFNRRPARSGVGGCSSYSEVWQSDEYGPRGKLIRTFEGPRHAIRALFWSYVNQAKYAKPLERHTREQDKITLASEVSKSSDPSTGRLLQPQMDEDDYFLS